MRVRGRGGVKFGVNSSQQRLPIVPNNVFAFSRERGGEENDLRVRIVHLELSGQRITLVPTAVAFDTRPQAEAFEFLREIPCPALKTWARGVTIRHGVCREHSDMRRYVSGSDPCCAGRHGAL
jgi:hypothetical protein